MKFAQEVRAGNVIMINSEPMVVRKSEYSKSGRNAAVVKMRLQNLFSGTATETIYKADEKFEDVMLERKDTTYSYNDGNMFVFMDPEYNQYEVAKDVVGESALFLADNMECQLTLYNEKPIAIELPKKIVQEVAYTEPAARGDTSGKVMKNAKLNSGFELQVPAFIEIGEKIEIDTATGEYSGRVGNKHW
jgi:elongation factor P